MTTLCLPNLHGPFHRSDGSGRSDGSDGSVGSALQAPCAAHRAPGSALRAVRFTLVELLVALVVLAILMMVLFRFFNAAQNVWTLSAANMRLYQNARAALDLVEQDFKSVVLSNDAGARIHLFNHPSPGDMRLTFVSAVGESSAYASELVEVSYKLDGSEFKRAEVGDDAGAAWNFLGDLVADGGIKPANWHSNGTLDFQTVIGGVEAVEMAAYDRAGNLLAAGNHVDVARISVELTLVDEGLPAGDPRLERTRRVFTKTVFLSR